MGEKLGSTKIIVPTNAVRKASTKENSVAIVVHVPQQPRITRRKSRKLKRGIRRNCVYFSAKRSVSSEKRQKLQAMTTVSQMKILGEEKHNHM